MGMWIWKRITKTNWMEEKTSKTDLNDTGDQKKGS